MRYGILGAILTSVLLAGAASFLLTRQVTRPLSETRDAAIRVASGDYATAVPVKSSDELGELARAFNYMAEEIEHYVGEIQEQKSRLEAVLEASPEALVTTDPGGRVTMVNPAAARMLGIRPPDRGRTLEDLGAPQGILQCLREAAANGVAVREVELEDKAYWAYAAQMNRDEGNGSIGGEAGIILASQGHNRAPFAGEDQDGLRLRRLPRAQDAACDDPERRGLLERARERLDPLSTGRWSWRTASSGASGDGGGAPTLAQLDAWQYQLEVGPTDLSRILQTALVSVESKAARFGIEVTLTPPPSTAACATPRSSIRSSSTCWITPPSTPTPATALTSG